MMTQTMDSNMDEFFDFAEASYREQPAITETVDAFPIAPFDQPNGEK
jgi:hypothetical protein